MRALLLACCLLFPAFAAAAEPLRTIGYVAWWMPDSWRTLALEKFDRLLFFDLMFDASGEISERHGWPENWNELRAAALLSQTPLDLTLTCTDPVIFNRLFGSPAAVNILLEQAVALAAQDGVAGLQLDVEIYQGAKPAAIQAYRAFTRALSEQLHLGADRSGYFAGLRFALAGRSSRGSGGALGRPGSGHLGEGPGQGTVARCAA
jgi:hypothetical protein